MIAPLPSSRNLPVFPRLPAVVVCGSFLGGVLLDRWIAVPLHLWLIVGSVLLPLMGGLLYRGKRQGVILALLLLWVTLGGGRHSLFWSGTISTDLAHIATEGPQSVRVVGTVSSSPVVQPAVQNPLRSVTPQEDRTRFSFRPQRLLDERNALLNDVSGQVRVNLSGVHSQLQVGQRVRLQGRLSLPLPPANPGEFDYGEYLKQRGCSATLFVAHPDAVDVLGEPSRWELHWWFLRGISRLRTRAETILNTSLSNENAAMAAALLIGNRTQMTPELQRSFVESGTLHVLAISGLHVGILVGVLLLLSRLAKLSPVMSSLLICGLVVMYALLTEGRPSVVRATVLLSLILLARPWAQPVRIVNSLAVAALLLVFWNPSTLFQTGAQLSFLAVLGILRFAQWQTQRAAEPPTTDAILDDLMERPWWMQALRLFQVWFVQAFLLMATIWVFTLPLVAARFHIVSLVGLLLNVFLIPAVAVILWCGYLTLFVGFVVPFAVPAVAWSFAGGLSLVRILVETAGEWNLGHLYIPGPADWWLWGYYLLLLFWSWNSKRSPLVFPQRSLTAFFRQLKTRRWCAVAWCSWILLGLVCGFPKTDRDELRCTFLAVGHGNAILLECPQGKTFLYDAGSLQDGDRASRVIQEVLWSKGIGHLDTLMVSHADLDHFNAVPDLTARIPVGSILMSPQQVRQQSSSQQLLLQKIDQQNVPLQAVSAGDQVLIDPQVQLALLHPQPHHEFPTDNENSLVLLVQYAGRRILLTGDLEHAGLDAFLELPRRSADVVLAPHHGSQNVDHPAFAAWAQPQTVIISGGRRETLSKLRSRYPADTRLYSTVQSGAITVTVSRTGKLHLRTFFP